MSTIQRSVIVNPVESSPLSFRIPIGIDMQVDIDYQRMDATPYSDDVAGQLFLTGRTSGRTLTYVLPAIDRVNGKARAFLPAGDLDDLNGYRAQLVGTIDQQPMLIAEGVVMTTAMDYPVPVTVDTIDDVDLAFQRDEDVLLNVKVWADDGKDVPYDLTDENTSLRANVYNAKGGAVLVPFTVTVISVNEVQLSLTKDQVNVLPNACWWNLTASSGAGLTTLCEGDVTVSGTITPPFADVTASYNYIKQDVQSAPASGQIIHSNYVLDAIRMHIFDNGGTDRSALLAELRLGDTITAGVTTWSIQSISQPGADWYAIYIAPATQLAASGVQAFVFHRP
jgi:hypothetical protein